MKKLILCLFPLSVSLVACNGGGGGSSSSSGPSAQAIPRNYQCYPSQLPSVAQPNSLQIAYAGNCSVESASQSVNLQKMAVALERYEPANTSGDITTESGFYNFCTGTPIKYNSTTGVTFIVTAAHCVVGTSSPKAAGAPTTAANISTFVVDDYGHNNAWIVQGTSAGGVPQGQLTAQVLAVYVPSQYCQAKAYTSESGIYSCNGIDGVDIPYQNGDFAILKVQAQAGKSVTIANNVKLAPSNLNLTSSSTNLLALGYGGTNPNGTVSGQNPSNSFLNYINTTYFGTNNYGGSVASMTIMNGYFKNNIYYSLICGGDSGGGDFAWDGSNWNLVGVHSWGTVYGGMSGSVKCGSYGTTYVANASADVRQFNNWIEGVLNGDNQAKGCASLGSRYACAFGTAQ